MGGDSGQQKLKSGQASQGTRRLPAKKFPGGKDIAHVVGLEGKVLWKLSSSIPGSAGRSRLPLEYSL